MFGQQAQRMAHELLERIAAGAPVEHVEAAAFGALVLAHPAFTLAAQTVAGGPHALDRLVALARLVLDLDATEAQRPADRSQRGA